MIPREIPWNFRPRVSAAYLITNNTVIRGAYGQYTQRVDTGYTDYTSDPGPFAALQQSYTNCFISPGTTTCNPNLNGGSSLFGFPSPFPDAAANPISSSSQSVSALPSEWHPGVMHQFNLQLEKQVHNNGFRIGYIGGRSVGWNYNFNTNIKPANTTPYILIVQACDPGRSSME